MFSGVSLIAFSSGMQHCLHSLKEDNDSQLIVYGQMSMQLIKFR